MNFKSPPVMNKGRENLPPSQDTVSEVWLISSMLQWKETVEPIRSELPAEAFRSPGHKEIVEEIYRREEAAIPFLLADILQHFDVTEQAWIRDVAVNVFTYNSPGWCVSALDNPTRIGLVKESWDAFTLWNATAKAKRMFENGEISREEYVEQLQLATLAETQKGNGITSIKDASSAAIDELEEIIKARGAIRGVRSGLELLDGVTSGWRGGQLIILAARTAVGKSALAINMALAAAKDGHNTAFFTLEMKPSDLSLRMICQTARIGLNEFKDGSVSKHHYNSFATAHRTVQDLPIVICDTPSIPIVSLRAKARAMHEQNPLKLIIVDYLQICTGTSKRSQQNRHLEIAEITGGLKALAMELNIPVIALSQLNRNLEQRKDGIPVLSDLRESGSIEQDADVVLLLHRKKEQPSEEALLIVAKNRAGQSGVGLKLWFDGPLTKFSDAN